MYWYKLFRDWSDRSWVCLPLKASILPSGFLIATIAIVPTGFDWPSMAGLCRCPSCSRPFNPHFVGCYLEIATPSVSFAYRFPPKRWIGIGTHAKQELYLHQLDRYRDVISDSIAARGDRRLSSPVRISDLGSSSANGLPPQLHEKGAAEYGTPLIPARVLGQLQNTYILVETDGALWLLEQHVAHERVRYEQLQQLWELVTVEEPVLLAGLRRSPTGAVGTHRDSTGSIWGEHLGGAAVA